MHLIHSDWVLLYCFLYFPYYDQCDVIFLISLNPSKPQLWSWGWLILPIFMDREWGNNYSPIIQWYCFFLENLSGCCGTKWMNEQFWGHPRISYSPTVSLLQDFPFILCSVMLDLELCKLYFAGSLVSWLPAKFCQWEALQEDWRGEEGKGKFLLVFQFPSSSLQ